MSGNLIYSAWALVAIALYILAGFWLFKLRNTFSVAVLRWADRVRPAAEALSWIILIAALLAMLVQGVPGIALVGVLGTAQMTSMFGLDANIGVGVWTFCYFLLPVFGLFAVPGGVAAYFESKETV